jgi:hypothetical protein
VKTEAIDRVNVVNKVNVGERCKKMGLPELNCSKAAAGLQYRI